MTSDLGLSMSAIIFSASKTLSGVSRTMMAFWGVELSLHAPQVQQLPQAVDDLGDVLGQNGILLNKLCVHNLFLVILALLGLVGSMTKIILLVTGFQETPWLPETRCPTPAARSHRSTAIEIRREVKSGSKTAVSPASLPMVSKIALAVIGQLSEVDRAA